MYRKLEELFGLHKLPLLQPPFLQAFFASFFEEPTPVPGVGGYRPLQNSIARSSPVLMSQHEHPPLSS